jgi:predicted phage tail protein
LEWLHCRTSLAAKPPRFRASNNGDLRHDREVGKIMAITWHRDRSDTGEGAHTGTRGRQSIDPGRIEDDEAVVSRIAGAVLRAALMVILVILPSLMVAGTSHDTNQTVALVALVAALFTLAEYNSAYPSLVEFRYAPPFNRLRYIVLFLMVFSMAMIAKGKTDPSTMTDLFSMLGARLADVMDFPYSPVRLVVLMLPDNAPGRLVWDVRTAAGLSYLISLVGLIAFILILRIRAWPSQGGGAFNVWVNLPTFDPTAGGDVVHRLERDSNINLILGFLLPFMIPAIVKLASSVFDPISLANSHTLIWTMTAWAFLPASLIMRGIALWRLAQMIAAQRERTYMQESDEAEPSVV